MDGRLVSDDAEGSEEEYGREQQGSDMYKKGGGGAEECMYRKGSLEPGLQSI
jgi:hypothetical protein